MHCERWRNKSLAGGLDDPFATPAARRAIMAIRCCSLVAGYLLLLTPGLADWPQWRGPDRNGVTKDDVRLNLSWDEAGPEKLWQSETFPQENGSGSVVTSGDRAFVLVNWQEQVPTEQRRLDARVQNDLGVLDLAKMPPGLVTRLEASRISMPKKLGGSRLIHWIRGELPKILRTPSEEKAWKGPVERRLREGGKALPLDVMEILWSDRKRQFPSEAALITWLDEQSFPAGIQATILEKVPKTKPLAEDVIFCLDLATGKTHWKSGIPGSPDRTEASSTPIVQGGRLYACCSRQAVCLDVTSGKAIWSVDLPNGGTASSPLLLADRIIFLAGTLTALDKRSGRITWTNPDVRGKRASPAHWRQGDRDYLIVHGDKNGLYCVEAETGKLQWKVDGGGDSTPVVHQDQLIIHSAKPTIGLAVYDLDPTDPTLRWSQVFDESRGAASPLVYRDHIYLVGADTATCCALGTGKVHWQESIKGDISSPILADNKIIALTNNGGYLTVMGTDARQYMELAKVRIRMARCPSPALVKNRLLLRGRNSIECFDLSFKPGP